MFETELLEKVNSQAISGEYTPRQALEAMLAGTSLVVIEDPQSGTLAIKGSHQEKAEVSVRSPSGLSPVSTKSRDSEGDRTIKLAGPIRSPARTLAVESTKKASEPIVEYSS